MFLKSETKASKLIQSTKQIKEKPKKLNVRKSTCRKIAKNKP